jgi:hypothetical protein
MSANANFGESNMQKSEVIGDDDRFLAIITSYRDEIDRDLRARLDRYLKKPFLKTGRPVRADWAEPQPEQVVEAMAAAEPEVLEMAFRRFIFNELIEHAHAVQRGAS